DFPIQPFHDPSSLPPRTSTAVGAEQFQGALSGQLRALGMVVDPAVGIETVPSLVDVHRYLGAQPLHVLDLGHGDGPIMATKVDDGRTARLLLGHLRDQPTVVTGGRRQPVTAGRSRPAD